MIVRKHISADNTRAENGRRLQIFVMCTDCLFLTIIGRNSAVPYATDVFAVAQNFVVQETTFLKISTSKSSPIKSSSYF